MLSTYSRLAKIIVIPPGVYIVRGGSLYAILIAAPQPRKWRAAFVEQERRSK